MARKPKAPELDSTPAVPDVDILPESQQPEQTEPLSFEVVNQPPEVTAEETAILQEALEEPKSKKDRRRATRTKQVKKDRQHAQRQVSRTDSEGFTSTKPASPTDCIISHIRARTSTTGSLWV